MFCRILHKDVIYVFPFEGVEVESSLGVCIPNEGSSIKAGVQVLDEIVVYSWFGEIVLSVERNELSSNPL